MDYDDVRKAALSNRRVWSSVRGWAGVLGSWCQPGGTVLLDDVHESPWHSGHAADTWETRSRLWAIRRRRRQLHCRRLWRWSREVHTVSRRRPIMRRRRCWKSHWSISTHHALIWHVEATQTDNLEDLWETVLVKVSQGIDVYIHTWTARTHIVAATKMYYRPIAWNKLLTNCGYRLLLNIFSVIDYRNCIIWYWCILRQPRIYVFAAIVCFLLLGRLFVGRFSQKVTSECYGCFIRAQRVGPWEQ